MKSILITTFAVLAMFAVSQQAQASDRVKQINITDEVVPGGFDSTSDAYVVLSVHLGGCDHWRGAQVMHLPDNVTEVSAFAVATTGQICPMIVRIVQQEVNLGKLTTGSHHIHFMNVDGTFVERDVQVE